MGGRVVAIGRMLGDREDAHENAYRIIVDEILEFNAELFGARGQTFGDIDVGSTIRWPKVFTNTEHTSQCIGECTKKDKTGYVGEAEMLGAELAVNKAIQDGWTKIFVGGDSTQVTKVLREVHHRANQNWVLITTSIKAKLDCFSTFWFRSAPRGCNTLVHNLAKWSSVFTDHSGSFVSSFTHD
ncbi:hypothetical protein IFM89_007013 [Coptis chinensis]|uniref:RNase H type-1 domain-containing protein n=1 Tax=Coptis chinensis TaxID=261450 RepID=A0A835IPR5_9MAGN|nr:hypothetical protein IFM89_007013 [Coptis chinensis]